MKQYLVTFLTALGLAATAGSALADDTLESALGGGLGGAAGAAIGGNVGGQTGAVIGGGLGGAGGAVIADKLSDDDREDRYYRDHHRHPHPPHHRGHGCPPGHAKHGRC